MEAHASFKRVPGQICTGLFWVSKSFDRIWFLFLSFLRDAHLQGHSQDMAIVPVTVVNSCRNIIQKWSNCLFANLLSMNLGVHEQWIFFRPGSCGRNHNMLTLHDRPCFILYAWVYCTVDDDFSEFRTKFWLWMGRLPLKILWTGLF